MGPRNLKTKEVLNVGIEIAHPLRSMITFKGASLSYYISELLWYENGSLDVSFIANFSKFWNKLKDDDNKVVSNYGWWIFCDTTPTGKSQFENVVDVLKSDRLSRRAVIHIKDRVNSELNDKDIPCTESLQFFIRQNELHMTTTMRSNDAVFGLPYDIFFFTILQMFMLKELREEYPHLRLGAYTHFVKSMHIYEKDYEKMGKWVQNFEEGIPDIGYAELETFLYKLNFHNIGLAYSIINQALKLGVDRPFKSGEAIMWRTTGEPISDALIISTATKFYDISIDEMARFVPQAFQEVYRSQRGR